MASRTVSPILKRAALEELARRKLEAERIRQSVPVVDYEQEPKIYHDGKWFPLHEGEQQAWRSERRYIAVFKGWQAGGTVIGPPWLRREMQRRGPGDYAVIAPTMPLLTNKALPELNRAFAGMYHSSGNEYIITPTGALKLWGDERAEGRILLRHATRVEAIEAFTARGIWVDEPGQIDDEIFEQIESRGGVYRARFLLTSRPYRFNFYVRRFWDPFRDRLGNVRPEPLSTEDVECINFSSWMNEFMREEYEEQAKKMVGPDGKPNWRFRLKYDAIPTKPAGVVCENFDEERNTFEDAELEIPASWQTAQGTDFGEVNTGAVFAAHDPTNDRWEVYDEYHSGRVSVDDHVAAWRLHQTEASQDPWAWGGAPSEDDWRENYALAGYAILQPPIADRLLGFQKLNEMFASGRLRISKSCVRLLNQIADLSYDLSETGEPMPFKPIPHEREFHLLAALRYLATAICDYHTEAPKVMRPKVRDPKEDEKAELERRMLGSGWRPAEPKEKESGGKARVGRF